jgi:hypothetical protein
MLPAESAVPMVTVVVYVPTASDVVFAKKPKLYCGAVPVGTTVSQGAGETPGLYAAPTAALAESDSVTRIDWAAGGIDDEDVAVKLSAEVLNVNPPGGGGGVGVGGGLLLPPPPPPHAVNIVADNSTADAARQTRRMADNLAFDMIAPPVRELAREQV